MDLLKLQSDPAAFRQQLAIPAARGAALLGTVMAEFQARDFAALDASFMALRDGRKPEPSRFWWERTKGASKDSDLAVMLLWLLAFTRRALGCQVGAADQDQADELRKAAKAILRLNPWLQQLLTIQNWTIINPRTDSRCDIIAADVAGSHGARPDLLILNELSHVSKQEFAENLLDNAAKVPHGVVCIATNAGHLDSWQWKLRATIRDSDRWHFSAYTQPAPWLDPKEIEERRRATSANRFARLWCGEWVPDSGDALNREDIEAAVRTDGPMTGNEPGWVFTAGLDIGLSKDATALVVVGKHAGRYRLAHAQAWHPGHGQRVELEIIEAAAIEAHKRFRLRKLNFDPHQAEMLAERLGKAGVPMERVPFSGANLTLMATMVLDLFTSHSIDLYRHPQLVNDLGRLRVQEKSYGLRLDSPRGPSGHGDLATALALGLLAARDVSTASWGPQTEQNEDDLRRWGNVADRAPAGVFADSAGSIIDSAPAGVFTGRA